MADRSLRLLIGVLVGATVSACANTQAPAPPAVAAWEISDADDPARTPPPSSSRPSTSALALDRGLGSAVERPPLLEPGTGVFAKPPMARPEPLPDGAALTFNFVDADIREVVRAILGDGLGLDYVVDPEVKGNITVQTSGPLPRAEVIPMLERILRMHDTALVQQGRLYAVLPLKKAMASGTGRQDAASGFGLRVIPLRHIGVGEMTKILAPFVPADRIVKVEGGRNVLLANGTRQELDNIQQLVDTFDVDWLEGMSFGLIPVQATRLDHLVAELDSVFGAEGDGPLAGLVRFLPLERLRSVLVITSRPSYLAKARRWIEELDRGSQSSDLRMFVYPVQNGNASELAAVLRDVFGAGGGGATGQSDTVPGQKVVQLRGKGGSGLGRKGEPHLASAQSAASVPDIEEVTPALSGLPPLGGDDAPSGMRIIADPKTNTLVVLATPREYELVQVALQNLDVVPLQVLLEATVAEVTLNDDLQYGVQWFFKAGANRFTFSQSANGAVNPFFPSFSWLLDTADARVALSALASITDVKVISAPHLMVLDNQVARLQVGDQVPVATQSAVSVLDPNAPIVNTIQFRDTGVILEVRPRVNDGGLVILDIIQEVSDVAATTTSGIDSPTIQQRQVSTTVAVRSGETIALGGLIRDNGTVAYDGIPFLSRLPIIGPLFRFTTEIKRRTELLILITPRVVTNEQEARDATQELRSRMRGLAPLPSRIQ